MKGKFKMCNCNKNFHCITNTTYTPDTSLVLAMSNTNNISNRARFNFIVNRCISNIVTGSPVQIYITGLNGQGAIPVYTKFGNSYPLYSDLLSKYYTRLCNGTAFLGSIFYLQMCYNFIMQKQSQNQSNTKKNTKIIFNPKSNVMYQDVLTNNKGTKSVLTIKYDSKDPAFIRHILGDE